MKICLKVSEPVTIPVEQESVPIQHYLRQPQRLVSAIADPKLMEILGGDRYRLKMRPLNLLNLYHFQPTVVLKVWSSSRGTVYLQSESSEIRGVNYINARFSLKVNGLLSIVQKEGKTYLKGEAFVEVNVELPQVFSLTPKSLLETAGQSLAKNVLMRIKQRLLSHLIADYQQWAKGEELILSDPVNQQKSTVFLLNS
ncbi:DUF1997 domain-containing protein [Spirulina sp. 06S082]|uniref:DUF1997 domain-containing protein n=1 Tax=Spirulina sp. 06S082 TaxID=3110248 RepID=UPI002B1EE889|nr:DUF1997 domain-containing protein [Spirulina sp. 06S082]MEA5470634.1 DUF1997 domain-containing protein [Spirulina sp. 06S082]